MADSSERFGDKGIIELTGKIMVVAIVLLLFIVLFVFCLHLYAKYFWYRRRENPISAPDPLRSRLHFAAGHHDLAVPRRGLDPSVLKTLPVIVFDPNGPENGLECAICLSEISLGEETRFLPKCSHGFHLECIGMWFDSHSTCPMCRKPVDDDPSRLESSHDPPLDFVTIQISALENLSHGNEAPNFPTNVLIWGNETQVTTFGSSSVEENNRDNIVVEQSLVGSTSGSPSLESTVEIARELNEDDKQKSSSMPMGLRSIRRLLSCNNNDDRKVNPSSSRNSDFSS
ncbi:RING-H2 finger protein ATL3 [Striga hermonthica]|uniref:RING-type E3 ubiquitin transferase n=1 Tax=Striga hermonthica TaxID=68872 RepID=A0A9N7RBK1_STRHE|nr:RING-H2 finger protein ATL3 [Striga hermonthica]